MKRVAILSILIVLLTTLVLPGSNPVEAQSAPTWNSIIAYFNPNPGPDSPPEELELVLYKTDGTQIHLDFGNSISGALPMLPYQSGTLLLGEVVGGANFQGSAMVSATVPIMAVYKKVANNNEPYSPILYTSFDISHAGQGELFIPSVRRQAAYDTQIGIQNVESLKIDLEISVYDLDGTEILTITPGVTHPLNTYIFKMSGYPEIPMPFEGSLVVRAWLSETTVAARIVAAVQEIQAGGRRAFAYEGLAAYDTVSLMPTAACQAGETALSTTFVVQNTGPVPTDVHIDYMGVAGDMLGNGDTISIPPFASHTFDTCGEDVIEFTQGQDMSAIIVSEDQQIAVVGKLESNDGLMTAFAGQPLNMSAGSAGYRLVLPYVEWAARPGGFQTTISVMNASGNPAQDVKAYYYANKGIDPVAVHNVSTAASPLLPYTRRTTSPVAARAVEGRGFNGAVILVSDQPIVALARVVRTVDVSGYKTLGEDYNAIPYNP